MNENTIQQFHYRALQVFQDVGRATGYWAQRYLQKVRRDGGVKAVKHWLNPHRGLTGGFLKLVEYGKLEYSVEAIAIEKPFSGLFTTEELAVARDRLNRYGFFETIKSGERDSILTTEELASEVQYPEGAKKRIIVNAYERNRAAREKCIEKYGKKCYVCSMDFAQKYGNGAATIIHVHHLCSPSAIGGEYNVDPIADLRPVCPNCHAVIHLKNPPHTIEEVRAMIKNNQHT